MLKVLFTLFFVYMECLATPSGFAPLVSQVEGSVVHIRVKKRSYPKKEDSRFDIFREFFGIDEEGPFMTLGSGIILTQDGFVLTNNHLIGDADSVTVYLNNKKKAQARIIGRDLKTDLAVLKIEEKNLTPVKWSSDGEKSLKKGDWVIAVGSPYGLRASVSHGIISYVVRESRSFKGIKSCYGSTCEQLTTKLLQFDAPVNQGNSGGGLFSVDKGFCIGIITMMMSSSGGNHGVNFAIAASEAKYVADQIKEHGRVFRSYIGIKMQSVDESLFQAHKMDQIKNKERKKFFGAIVSEVAPNGPAQKAGIKPEDIIVSINGAIIKNQRKAQEIIWKFPVNKAMKLEVWSRVNGVYSTKILTVKTELLPEQIDWNRENNTKKLSFYGLHLVPVGPEDVTLRKIRGISNKVKNGLFIIEIDSVSSFAKNLTPGDVIIKAQGKQLSSLADFEGIVGEALKKGEKYMTLLIARGEDLFSCAVELRNKEK